ncbi:MAG: RHS domain-containing protein, partial [candidate division Zixibacteria bacterium]|nr:RHS domain-containing protein [candidate division Zixibacteria bacterium]
PPPSGPETRYWFHNDHLGTPYVFTDSNKAVMWRLSTDPFGEVVSELTPPQYDENLRFPGQIADRSTGLNYNWHRYYQPKVGRYYQVDPVFDEGLSNRYGYAEANPVLLSDATGLQSSVSDFLINTGRRYLSAIECGRHFEPEALQESRSWRNLNSKEIKKAGGGRLGTTNGPPDAFRHCYWTCRMTQECGQDIASLAGRLNEDRRLWWNPRDQEAMDLYNNVQGIESGSACPARGVSKKTLCRSSCEQRWRFGLLRALSVKDWTWE